MHKSNGKFLNEDFDLKVYTDSPRMYLTNQGNVFSYKAL